MFTKTNLNKNIRFFLVFIMAFLFLTNVFAYVTKNTMPETTKNFANERKINYVEFSPYKNDPYNDITIDALKEGGCEITISIKNPSVNVTGYENNKYKYAYHIMVSAPLQNKKIYFENMNNFVKINKKNNSVAKKIYSIANDNNFMYFYKIGGDDMFKRSKFTFVAPPIICNSSTNDLDVVMFIPTSNTNIVLDDYYNNVYVHNYSPFSERGLEDSFEKLDLATNSHKVLDYVNGVGSRLLLNLDFAFNVIVNKSKLNEINTDKPSQSNPAKPIPPEGAILPEGTITPKIFRRTPPENSNSITNSDLIRHKHVILDETAVKIIEKTKNLSNSKNQEPNILNNSTSINETAIADDLRVNIENIVPFTDEIACKLEIKLAKTLEDYPKIAPTEMQFLISWNDKLRSTYPMVTYNFLTKNEIPEKDILVFNENDYDKIYDNKKNITGYKLKIPEENSFLCSPRVIDVYAFMPIEKKSYEVVLYNTNTIVFSFDRGIIKETKLSDNKDYLYLNKKPEGSIDFYNYNLDFLYSIKTIDEELSQIINGGTCPGKCGLGYVSSSKYPVNYQTSSVIYNGSGALCYKCNEEGTIATRCDPITGTKLGIVNLINNYPDLKEEICPFVLPEINIDVPLIIEGELTTKPVELPKSDPNLVTIGSFENISNYYFDCSITDKDIFSKIQNQSYTENISKNTLDSKYLTQNFNADTGNVGITIDPHLFKFSNYFKQVNNYANACFYFDLDMPELENKKVFIKQENATFVNGEIFSKLTILDAGKVKLCVTRPITKLSDDERIIKNKPYMLNDNIKTFSLKEKRTILFGIPWFSKKIKDITFTLNTEIDSYGCDLENIKKEELLDQKEFLDNKEFLNLISSNNTCYDPQGTTMIGFTGEDEFNKYGFDKLLFIYDEDGITHNICDYGQLYCDQDQLKTALIKKAELIKKGNTIALDGILFNKSEDNKIKNNPYIYLTETQNNLFLENFNFNNLSYSDNSSEYLEILINQLSNIPKELRKFTILDLTFTTDVDPKFVALRYNNFEFLEADILSRINILSNGNHHNYLKQEIVNENPEQEPNTENKKQAVISYQITLDSFSNNQNKFKEQLNNNLKLDFPNKEILKDIFFLHQLITNMKYYYGDSVSSNLINVKTFGSLNEGLTKEVFEDKMFMSSFDESIFLSTDSEIKEISSPGLYLFDIKIENNQIKYNVKNVSEDTKKVYDYYNLSAFKEYKQNLLFESPINAIYKNYIGIPFKFDDRALGNKLGNATVFSNYSNWEEIQDGFILKFIFKNNNVDNITFKDIRPIIIKSTENYTYKYLTPNGQYSNNVEQELGNKILFAFLNYNVIDSQIVFNSEKNLLFNVLVPVVDKGNIKEYRVSNNLDNSDKLNFDVKNIYDGVKTAHIGYMLGLIKDKQICFNLENNNINFWFNPSKINMVDNK